MGCHEITIAITTLPFAIVGALAGRSQSAADVDYQLSECAQALQTSDGMLTASYRCTSIENGQAAIGRTASAVFTRLTHQRSP
jgi:hypothetical protein